MNPRLMRPMCCKSRVPGAPTITVASVAEGLRWTPAASNGGCPVTGFRIYGDGGIVGAVGSMAFAWPNVFAGLVYQVAAVNVAGEGPKSLPATAA